MVGGSSGGDPSRGGSPGEPYGRGPSVDSPPRDGSSGRSPSRRGSIWLSPSAAAAAAPLAYLVGALLLSAGVWGSPTTSWIGRCCDPEQFTWFLGWTPYALTHGLDPFFTTSIGAPAGVNLMWNAAMPALGVLSWLPAQVGGPIFGFNVMLVAGVALSGWTAYLALRRYAGPGLGAFVGGAVYAFSPYVASHAQIHLNLAHAWIPPLFLLVLDELLVRGRRSAWLLGIALGLLAVVQLLMSEEILATSVIAAAVLVGVMAASTRRAIGPNAHRSPAIRAATRRLTTAIATATVTFLVLGGWPLAAQFLGPQRLTGAVQGPDVFSTDLLNPLLPTPFQLLAPAVATDISSRFSGLYHEATGYIGLPLLALLAAIAISRWGDLRIRIATLTGLILLVLSFGARLHVGGQATGIPMPWLLFGSLPLLEHVLPARLTVFVWLAVAGVVAIAVADARQRGRRGAARLLAVAIALAAILPVPLAHSAISIPRFFERWDDQGIAATDTLLIAPLPGKGTEAAPMLWAAIAGYDLRMVDAYAFMPLPDGTTGAGPPPTTLSEAMQSIQRNRTPILPAGTIRSRIAADIAAAGIRHVIVGPMPARAPMVDFFTNLFGRPPEEIDGVAIWRDVDIDGVSLGAGSP